ncbi:hypothetical protein MKX03_027322 [Papaver bracteatum]|nr:hypothetical protein MKX03_027322 [Papaver bracteatum]
MGQALHIVDLEGVLVYWNRAAEQIFGYSASEALGQNMNRLIVEERNVDVSNKILERNASSGENWTGIFPIRSKQGRLIQVIGTTSPFYDDSGTLVGIICVSVASDAFQDNIVRTSPGTEQNSLSSKPLGDDSYPPSSSWLCNPTCLTSTRPDFDLWHKPLKAILPSMISKLISRSKKNKVRPKMRTLEAAPSDHSRVDSSLKNVRLRNTFGYSADGKGASKNGVYVIITSGVKGISWSWESIQILQGVCGKEVSNNKETTNSMGTGSTSSSTRRKFYMETDYLNYDISLNNLTFREQIGRGT